MWESPQKRSKGFKPNFYVITFLLFIYSIIYIYKIDLKSILNFQLDGYVNPKMCHFCI